MEDRLLTLVITGNNNILLTLSLIYFQKHVSALYELGMDKIEMFYAVIKKKVLFLSLNYLVCNTFKYV